MLPMFFFSTENPCLIYSVKNKIRCKQPSNIRLFTDSFYTEAVYNLPQPQNSDETD